MDCLEVLNDCWLREFLSSISILSYFLMVLTILLLLYTDIFPIRALNSTFLLNTDCSFWVGYSVLNNAHCGSRDHSLPLLTFRVNTSASAMATAAYSINLMFFYVYNIQQLLLLLGNSHST